MLSRLDRLRSEDGNIFVVAALTMLFLSLLGAAVLQVGDLFQHRRHLQTRADAAALAAGQQFNACFDVAKYPNPETDGAATNVKAWATAYAGFSNADTVAAGAPTENAQFGAGTDPFPNFNMNTYPDGVNTGDTTGTGLVCGDATTPPKLDVKVADTKIPPLFKMFGVGNVHAHARIQLKLVQALRPTLALAIPSFDTSAVGVTFVNEATGLELTGCTGPVIAGTTCTYGSSGAAVQSNGLKQWTLTGLGVNVPSGVNVGARVSAGSPIGTCANTTGTSQYACFDTNNNSHGISMIRGYAANQPATAAPALDGVWPSTFCGTGAPFFSDSSGVATCGTTVTAEVDFGTGATDPTTNASLGAAVTATVDGTKYPLGTHTYDPTRKAWLFSGATSSVTVDAAAATSEHPVVVSWSTKDKFGTSNNKNDDFAGGAPVQRFTSATDDDDGPIKDFLLTDASAPNGAYSELAGVHTLSAQISIATNGITNKLTTLRGSHNGSATAFILCVPGLGNGDPQIIAGLTSGCTQEYQVNPPPYACPDAASPPDCADNKPSSDNGTVVPKALNDRFNCGSANQALNNWPDYTKAGDPRAVTLIITTYNAYAANGKQQYPVTGFGDFYISGFSGSKCPQSGSLADDPPPPGASTKKNASDIWGYFIKYDRQGAKPSSTDCDRDTTLGTCVAVLTR
jgi:hypothetical protein